MCIRVSLRFAISTFQKFQRWIMVFLWNFRRCGSNFFLNIGNTTLDFLLRRFRILFLRCRRFCGRLFCCLHLCRMFRPNLSLKLFLPVSSLICVLFFIWRFFYRFALNLRYYGFWNFFFWFILICSRNFFFLHRCFLSGKIRKSRS